MIDGVLAGTAYSNDLDSSERFYLWFDLWHTLKLNFRCAYLIREGRKEKQLTSSSWRFPILPRHGGVYGKN